MNATDFEHTTDLGAAVWVSAQLLTELGIPPGHRTRIFFDVYRFDKRRWKRELRRVSKRFRAHQRHIDVSSGWWRLMRRECRRAGVRV